MNKRKHYEELFSFLPFVYKSHLLVKKKSMYIFDLNLISSNHTTVLKDRQQEAERHSRYLALLSISDTYNIISYTK